MDIINPNDFDQELECVYDSERYSVRDNGAIKRHPRDGKCPRPKDNQWTFGKPNEKTGYMELVTARVHRIVATAYHGSPPNKEYVVDHIDTNRRNNRPENLRWLTRLENALNNPITVRRIELVCGSIEAFLEDPSRLSQGTFDRNFDWMRTVNREEAKSCLERMSYWATNTNPPSGGAFGEWVYQPAKDFQRIGEDFKIRNVLSNDTTAPEMPEPIVPADPALTSSITAGAAQRKWKTPTEFPHCPSISSNQPLLEYLGNLKAEAIFSTNGFGDSTVVNTALSSNYKTLWVMCNQKEAIKQWSLAQVTYEHDLYIHTSLGTFFEKVGAEKAICLAQGLEWDGEDSIDDYC